MDDAINLCTPFCGVNCEETQWGFAEMMSYAVFVSYNGRINYCNRSGANLIGYSSAIEVKGKCIREFIYPDLLEEYDNLTSSSIEADNVCPIIETKLVKRDGNIIDVEIGSSSFRYKEGCGIYSIIRDITSSNNVKRSLEASEEKYRTLVEMLPDAICLGSKGKLLYVNMTAALDLGCENPEELVGKEITDFIVPYPLNGPGIDDYAKELQERGYIPFREECYIRKTNGEIMPREIAVRLIPNAEEPTYLLISRDISERKCTEELNKRMKEKAKVLDEAVEYDKVRTEFFANISHEFRTPLNVMLSALQLSGMVLNDSPASECKDKINKYMNLMKQNCYRLIRLVNNLIDITRIDTGYLKISPEECNIVSIIEEITLSVKDYIEDKGISLTFDTDNEEIIMACDPDKIERIMLNLLSNALKFTNSPGCITVNISDKNGNVIISVKDTGIGVPEDKETLIFDRFQQVDKSLSRNHEGSGIGLSLVRSLVEMHNGSIRLNSNYNEGSEFIIELPINNYLDKRPIDKKGYIHESNLERINIEFSDIYF